MYTAYAAPGLALTILTTAAIAMTRARHIRRRVRTEAAQHTDILVLAAENTLDHWATVDTLRYAYPDRTGGTSTQQPLPLGPANTATAVLVFTDYRSHRRNALTTSDIAAALRATGIRLPVDGSDAATIDALLQQAVFGKLRYPHPSTHLDMNRIINLLRAADIDCHIENTGGGCATIIIGMGDRPHGPGMYDAVLLAGPGWFARNSADPTRLRAYGNPADFYIGPEDDGEGETWTPRLHLAPADSEADIAARIVAQLRPDQTQHQPK